MSKTVQDVMNLIQENNIQMVDFKMVDINGQYRHVTIPAKNFNEDVMRDGRSGRRCPPPPSVRRRAPRSGRRSPPPRPGHV